MWLIRQSESLGIGAESAWLAPWLQSQSVPVADSEEPGDDSDDQEPHSEDETPSGELLVHYYTQAPEGMPGVWQAETPELVMQLLAQGAAESKVNLLSGQYKQQPAWRKYLKPWRKVLSPLGSCCRYWS